MYKKSLLLKNVRPLCTVLVGVAFIGAPAAAQDADELQKQIEELQRQLEELKGQVEQQRERTEEVATSTDQLRDEVKDTKGESLVTSGSDRLSLAVSGQINRMLNVGYDGNKTKLYNVDNDNSSSRFRFVGGAKVTDDFSAGFNIELEVESNSSASVSQENEDTGSANVNDRIIEATFTSEKLGKVSLGQGGTASDGTAEVDLSGTAVIGYSSVADTAGGLLFYDDDAGEYSDVTVGAAFSNFDGLGRLDRIRYDSPRFGGFQVSGSAVSDQRWDTALRWAADFGDTEAAAAIAYADPGGDDDYNISSSASVLLGFGLSFTGSFATRDNSGRDDSYNYYGKVGYQADFVDIGTTAFGVDYNFGQDIRGDGADSQSAGLQAVQNWSDYGIQFYTGLRWYTTDEADGEDLDLDDIVVMSAGTRVRF